MKGRYKLAIALGAASVAGMVFWPEKGFSQDAGNGAHEAKLDRIVSKHFDNANINQVFAWLVEQGFSYVVRDGNMDNVRVSLNIEHESVWDAARAVADALDGHWTREGRVYVFHRDKVTFGQNEDGSGYGLGFGGNGAIPLQMRPEQIQGLVKSLTGQLGGLGQMTPEQQEMFGKKMEDWGNKFSGQFGGKGLNGEGLGMSPDMEKKIEDMSRNLSGMPQGNMTPEQQKAFEKKMEDWSQRFSKQFDGRAFDGKGFGMNPDMQKKLEERLGGLSTKIQEELKNLPQMSQGAMTLEQQQFEKKMQVFGQGFGKNFGNGGLDAKQWAEFAKEWEEIGKKIAQEFGQGGKFNMPPMPDMDFKGAKGLRLQGELKGLPFGDRGAIISKSNLGKLLNSLTQRQKDVQDSQGYLTPSDLTEEQRAMFGRLDSGEDWELNFSMDGQKLHLKSK